MRKVLLLLLSVLLLLVACGNEEEAEETKEKPQDGEQAIKVDEEYELGNVKIEVELVKIDEDELTLPFWWSHWATNDKAHFEALAYVTVKQDGDELKATDKNDTLLKQTSKGVDSRIELKYELIDDSPVDITFKTTSDDPEEDGMTVDIK